jgi:hypothetical protein
MELEGGGRIEYVVGMIRDIRKAILDEKAIKDSSH